MLHSPLHPQQLQPRWPQGLKAQPDNSVRCILFPTLRLRLHLYSYLMLHSRYCCLSCWCFGLDSQIAAACTVNAINYGPTLPCNCCELGFRQKKNFAALLQLCCSCCMVCRELGFVLFLTENALLQLILFLVRVLLLVLLFWLKKIVLRNWEVGKRKGKEAVPAELFCVVAASIRNLCFATLLATATSPPNRVAITALNTQIKIHACIHTHTHTHRKTNTRTRAHTNQISKVQIQRACERPWKNGAHLKCISCRLRYKSKRGKKARRRNLWDTNTSSLSFAPSLFDSLPLPQSLFLCEC